MKKKESTLTLWSMEDVFIFISTVVLMFLIIFLVVGIHKENGSQKDKDYGKTIRTFLSLVNSSHFNELTNLFIDPRKGKVVAEKISGEYFKKVLRNYDSPESERVEAIFFLKEVLPLHIEENLPLEFYSVEGRKVAILEIRSQLLGGLIFYFEKGKPDKISDFVLASPERVAKERENLKIWPLSKVVL